MDLYRDGAWIYEWMGGRLQDRGASFRVWAPHAKSVFVTGEFNHWRDVPLERAGDLWVGFDQKALAGHKYQFTIENEEGKRQRKADPFALAGTLRPEQASRLIPLPKVHKALPHMPWERAPVNIYELHLGTWRVFEEGKLPSYSEIAPELASYCTNMGFTHVELLPLNEHPLDQSWGYQVTGYYAVTSRYGSLDDFITFVETLHAAGIGVIIDWVPGHFPKDDFGLSLFDGTPLFEGGEQLKWGTNLFDYTKQEVRHFLMGSALFWLNICGVDGLRIDAVSSILYCDFAEKSSGWSHRNEPGIAFIRALTDQIRAHHPGALLIAEEASHFPGVTRPTHEGGLGFDLKWNLGWTNDTLDYFAADPAERDRHHARLTFGMTYAFDERHALTLSHDEFAREGRNIHLLLPQEEREKQLLLLYTYLICMPGKKLFFMGAELGEIGPWSIDSRLDWERTATDLHTQIKALNHFYLENSALWERDFDWSGFEWISCDEKEKGILAYYRRSEEQELICVHNFSPSKQCIELPFEVEPLFGAHQGVLCEGQVAPLSSLILGKRQNQHILI